ncbi:MAG: hypothetical protein PVJ49_04980 [Acidobacteriota bacterium]
MSRQWVARRLQRALTVERWSGPARAGLSRCGGHTGRLLATQADASRLRAKRLELLIDEIGAVPYPTWGVGAPLTRAATSVVGLLSVTLAGRLGRLLAEHTLSEYRALESFVQDAAGVPAELFEQIVPLQAESAHELAAWASSLHAAA